VAQPERTWVDGPWYGVAVGASISLLLLVAVMACASAGTTLPLVLLRGYALAWQVATSEAGALLFWLAVLSGLGIARLRRRQAPAA